MHVCISGFQDDAMMLATQLHESYRTAESTTGTQFRHQTLHWLDVADRIRFKLCLKVYKCQPSMTPGYPAELCKPVANIDGHLWSAGRGQLDVPRVRLSTYGGRAFCYARPSAWNTLPDFKKQYITSFLCLLLVVSSNIFTSHITSTLSAFEVFFLQLTRYVNYLLIYLQSEYRNVQIRLYCVTSSVMTDVRRCFLFVADDERIQCRTQLRSAPVNDPEWVDTVTPYSLPIRPYRIDYHLI